MLTVQSIIQQKPSALSAEVGDEVVLMSLEQGKYYGLDAIASDIWRRIEEPIIISDLCSALATEYDADASAIEADVLALLEKLSAQNMLETRS